VLQSSRTGFQKWGVWLCNQIIIGACRGLIRDNETRSGEKAALSIPEIHLSFGRARSKSVPLFR